MINDQRHWALFIIRNSQGQIVGVINAFGIVPYLVAIVTAVFGFFVGVEIDRAINVNSQVWRWGIPVIGAPVMFFIFWIIDSWIGAPREL